ncbi:MAG: M91 family zinc metallopeptidase [Myxococcota bacterium]
MKTFAQRPESSSSSSARRASLELPPEEADRHRQELRGLPGFAAQSQALQRGLFPNARAGQLPPWAAASSSGAHHEPPAAQPPAEVEAPAEAAPQPDPVHPEEQVEAAAPNQAPPEVQEAGPGAVAAQPLPAGQRPVLAFAGADPAVAGVAELVAAYNALGPEATFQARFAALRRIDTAAYQAFQDHPSPDLGQLPFGPALRALLTHTEAEHADLVELTRERTAAGEEGHLPIDTTGMGEGEQAEAAALWSSLARRQGDLQVAGSPAFQKGTFGSLAKLMQGPLGRQLVGHLDRRAAPGPDGAPAPDRSVTITESEREPGASARDTTQSDMHEVGPGAGPDLDPRALTAAVLGGERHAAIGGRQFEFGQGSAVDVDMPSAMRDTRSLDSDKNEIVTPSFIALGHELGHAAKAKAGAKGTNVGFDKLPAGVVGGRWVNNPEEYLNVQGVENPLRAEHGMKQRGDYVDSVKRSRSDGLMRMVVQAVELYPSQGSFLADLALTARNNGLNDDALYAELRQRIEAGIEQARQAHEAEASGPASSSGQRGDEPRRRDRAKAWFKKKLGRE